MRQAGRILPEYKAIRAKLTDFKELVKSAELAAEVTLQPVNLLKVDAAILFSDILVIPEAMGLDYEMIEARGPFFPKTIQTKSDIDQLLTGEAAAERLDYVYNTISEINKYIPENIPLDYNFGYLIGAYAAEGSMTKFQVSIANNDESYYQPILQLCKQWNITTKVYKHENKGKEGWTSQDLRIYNTVLCRLLEKMCGKLSHNKFVSDKIVFSNKECLLGFIDAYIGGDGTINKKDKSIVMSSVSKDLLIDVQQILNKIDFFSKIFF
jgi:hypothetical protein